MDSDYPFDAYGVYYCHIKDDSPNILMYIVSRVKCQLFAALNIINNILNNICFMFISISIDVGLIKFTSENVARKKRLFVDEDTQDVIQAIRLKEKVNKMIITNGLLYFVSHSPEFVMTIVLLVFYEQLWTYCSDKMSCVEIIDIAQVFNFLSMGFQIFVFSHFDKNFSKSMENVLHKMLHKRLHKMIYH